jgi:hypothetical protein
MFDPITFFNVTPSLSMSMSNLSNLSPKFKKIAQVALDDRYANKFAPLNSTAIYPKTRSSTSLHTYDRWSGNALGYTFALRIPLHLLWCWCNTCTNHITNDMIHFISSCDLGPSILTSLALHRCVGPSAPSHAQASPSHAVPHSKASDLPFTLATGPSSQASSWSSPPWPHDSMSCLICNELLYDTITCGLISCVSHITTY